MKRFALIAILLFPCQRERVDAKRVLVSRAVVVLVVLVAVMGFVGRAGAVS